MDDNIFWKRAEMDGNRSERRMKEPVERRKLHNFGGDFFPKQASFYNKHVLEKDSSWVCIVFWVVGPKSHVISAHGLAFGHTQVIKLIEPKKSHKYPRAPEDTVCTSNLLTVVPLIIFKTVILQVGVAEMKVVIERTGGLVVLAESFGRSVFKDSFRRVYMKGEESLGLSHKSKFLDLGRKQPFSAWFSAAITDSRRRHYSSRRLLIVIRPTLGILGEHPDLGNASRQIPDLGNTSSAAISANSDTSSAMISAPRTDLGNFSRDSFSATSR
ncbi:hypothetical protein LXL04_006606 [Taraxacum kok-saghyz]